jgi:hypothetical protein
MRLTSSDEINRVAQHVIRLIVDASAAPVGRLTSCGSLGDEDGPDRLREFSEACRVELLALRG